MALHRGVGSLIIHFDTYRPARFAADRAAPRGAGPRNVVAVAGRSNATMSRLDVSLISVWRKTSRFVISNLPPDVKVGL
jgi:hypothetical protein